MFKGKIALFLALLLALAGALLTWVQLKRWKESVRRGWQLTEVVVAATDLQPGTSLSSDAIAIDKMPRKFVFDSVLVPAELEYALGREVIVPIKQGEPVLFYHLQGARSIDRLSKAISKRGRAVSIDVSERSSVGQWIEPNDHVDVLATFRDPNSNQMAAITLLQNVIVLATGQTNTSGRARREQYSTVTLLMLPEEAEILVLAQELGTTQLSLRNAEDISRLEGQARTTIETLLSGKRITEFEKKRYRSIQIIRGIKKTRSGR